MTTPIVPPDRRRRRAGTFMRTLAVFGVLTALGGAVAGWQLMGQIDDTLDDSLEITEETLFTLEETIELADALLDSVDDALVATEGSLLAVVDSTDEAVAVVQSVDELVGEVTPGLGRIEATLRDLSGIGSTIDSVLEQLDDIPFGPDYDPSRPLGEQFELLADDLAPIAESLAGTSEPLSGLADASGDLESELTALAQAVGEVNDELRSSGDLLDAYLLTAQRAQSVAADADADLGAETTRARVFLVLAAVLIAAGQFVPWWIGTELRRSTGAVDGDR
jgi:ABC-type transporter Mla subunit MlaD